MTSQFWECYCFTRNFEQVSHFQHVMQKFVLLRLIDVSSILCRTLRIVEHISWKNFTMANKWLKHVRYSIGFANLIFLVRNKFLGVFTMRKHSIIMLMNWVGGAQKRNIPKMGLVFYGQILSCWNNALKLMR